MPIIATCSDVSDRLPELKEPVDVIVLCGSFCPIFDKNLLSWNITNQVDYIEFKLNPWLDALPAPCKIIVGGRNDHIAEFYGHNLSYYLHAEYVQDDTINCKGMHVYGTPWIPPHMKSPDRADAFFSAKASKYIKAIERIPSFVDILVSNTYPREGESADLEADFALAKKIDSLSNLKLHIHSSARLIDEENYKPKRYVSVQAPPSSEGEFAIIRI
jgi:hypothetical protein